MGTKPGGRSMMCGFEQKAVIDRPNHLDVPDEDERSLCD